MRHLDNSTITTDEVTQFTFAEGETAGEYIPYNGTTVTISFGSTYYSGQLDVLTGVLTVDKAIVDLGTINWVKVSSNYYITNQSLPNAKGVGNNTNANAICSIYAIDTANHINSKTNMNVIGINKQGQAAVNDSTDYNNGASFKTAMNGVQLVYELATPQTIQLTANEVSSLLGNNVVWQSGNGDVTVEYRSN